MAYEVPALGTAGQVYTAAAHNIIVEDIRMFSVFTNEAARDAAITSPTEGMHAYLTAPTVPTATGTTTAIPIGVQTIYNGAVWVCVTPVGSLSNTTGTTDETSYVTTLTGDGTAISVTLVTGTTVRIDTSAVYDADQGGPPSAYLSFSVSGATTVAASNANSSYTQQLADDTRTTARSLILTGLTAGTNTFTLNYKVTGWGIKARSRNLIVTGVA